MHVPTHAPDSASSHLMPHSLSAIPADLNLPRTHGKLSYAMSTPLFSIPHCGWYLCGQIIVNIGLCDSPGQYLPTFVSSSSPFSVAHTACIAASTLSLFYPCPLTLLSLKKKAMLPPRTTCMHRECCADDGCASFLVMANGINRFVSCRPRLP